MIHIAMFIGIMFVHCGAALLELSLDLLPIAIVVDIIWISFLYWIDESIRSE